MLILGNEFGKTSSSLLFREYSCTRFAEWFGCMNGKALSFKVLSILTDFLFFLFAMIIWDKTNILSRINTWTCYLDSNQIEKSYSNKMVTILLISWLCKVLWMCFLTFKNAMLIKRKVRIIIFLLIIRMNRYNWFVFVIHLSTTHESYCF